MVQEEIVRACRHGAGGHVRGYQHGAGRDSQRLLTRCRSRDCAKRNKLVWAFPSSGSACTINMSARARSHNFYWCRCPKSCPRAGDLASLPGNFQVSRYAHDTKQTTTPSKRLGAIGPRFRSIAPEAHPQQCHWV